MVVEHRLIGSASSGVPGRVRELILPVVSGFELELVGVETTQEGHRNILWVYIDGPEGITIDDCARVSPEISAALDVDDPMPQAYELRVSSPGLDRPLMTSDDFERYEGRKATLQLSTPLGGRRKFTGMLDGMAEEGVRIDCADGAQVVPLEFIHRARLVYELPRGKKKK